jgi:transcriptional regulator with XRE-family HTH domain
MAITHWKRDGVIPSVETMMKAADYLGCSLRWLLTGEDPGGLSLDERDLLDSYRQLDGDDQREVVSIIALKLRSYPQKGTLRSGTAG